MAKRVFFAFHYQDVIDFRADVVRKHWVIKPDREEAGFFDASLWETAKKTSPLAVKRLINGGLDGTSVTSVLIGSQTYARPLHGLRGVYHGVSAKHLQAYLDEYAFRYNNSGGRRGMFNAMLSRVQKTSRAAS